MTKKKESSGQVLSRTTGGYPNRMLLKTVKGIVEVKNPIRFGIVLTYRCNCACPGCNRFLDFWDWPDSDIDLVDLREGFRRTQEAELTICKVRVSGGEPLLHLQYAEILPLLVETWNSWQEVHRYGRKRITIFTNGSFPIPVPVSTDSWNHRRLPPSKKKQNSFDPMMVSPKDLGMDGMHGWGGRICRRAFGCGMLFDVFGFSFCIHAPAIGRVVGIDPYSSHPTLNGIQEICEHCPYSLGRRASANLLSKIIKKEHDFEYPTATYRAAINRGKVCTFQKFKNREN